MKVYEVHEDNEYGSYWVIVAINEEIAIEVAKEQEKYKFNTNMVAKAVDLNKQAILSYQYE